MLCLFSLTQPADIVEEEPTRVCGTEDGALRLQFSGTGSMELSAKSLSGGRMKCRSLLSEPPLGPSAAAGGPTIVHSTGVFGGSVSVPSHKGQDQNACGLRSIITSKKGYATPLLHGTLEPRSFPNRL